jgi:hypothetical protein
MSRGLPVSATSCRTSDARLLNTDIHLQQNNASYRHYRDHVTSNLGSVTQCFHTGGTQRSSWGGTRRVVWWYTKLSKVHLITDHEGPEWE